MKPFNPKPTMWDHFLSIPQGQIRIAMYLVHHNNTASKDEIIHALTEKGGDPRKPASIDRILRTMKERGVLVDNGDGTLRLKNPRRYSFIIKYVRGNVWDRWYTLTIPFTILVVLFIHLNLVVAQVFAILTLMLLVLWVIDDRIHIQTW